MHTFLRTLKTATIALQRNVMRSALTCLGIIIGVSAVIAIAEIGQGSSAAIQKSISSIGANMLLVLPGTATSSGVNWGSGSVMTLIPDDCVAILRECPAVRDACPVVRAKSSQVVYGSRNWIPASINGTTPSFLTIRDWNDMAEGEPFTDRDVRNASKVCVIGQTLARELFQGESPIGKDIRLANVNFRVVGVLRSKGANMFGSDQDDIILAPWTTIKYRVSGDSFGGAGQNSSSSTSSSDISTAVNTLSQLYPDLSPNLYPLMSDVQAADTPKPVRFTNIDQIMVSAASQRLIPAATAQMTALLHERHRIPDGDPDDFMIRDMAEITKVLTKTTGVLAALLLGVAMISLIVGGVGIMNIMLVNVTERTREIGLRMAVGARSRDILRQFLVEAVILCLAGGGVGILLGCGGSELVRLVSKWPIEMSLPAILASVIVSATIGVVFGFYPAWKASRLDPIDALRYE
jgi:ABC-type antimicrobial peptide transport system permease subunit